MNKDNFQTWSSRSQENIVDVLRDYEKFKTGRYLDHHMIMPHAIRKLNEEVGELSEALMLDATEPRFMLDDVETEVADIYITLCRVASFYGVDIQKAALEKTCILIDRIEKGGAS